MIREINMSYYVNVVTFGMQLRMRAGGQENQPCNQRVGTFSPTPPAPLPKSPGKGEGLEVKLIASGQGFNQLCLCNETHKHPKGEGSESW